MTLPALLQVIQQARDEAKAILKTLEQTGHPQTNESSGIYLALVTIQKQLLARRPGASTADIAADLKELAALCHGNLEPLKPLLDRAVGLAQAGVASG